MQLNFLRVAIDDSWDRQDAADENFETREKDLRCRKFQNKIWIWLQVERSWQLTLKIFIYSKIETAVSFCAGFRRVWERRVPISTRGKREGIFIEADLHETTREQTPFTTVNSLPEEMMYFPYYSSASLLSPLLLAWLLIFVFVPSLDAFSLAPLISNKHAGTRSTVTIQKMAVLETAGLMAASGALGVLTQLPRIQELERELRDTRQSLDMAELKVKNQLEELEEKLFVMDKEFESQTAKFKKQYDIKMKEQLEQMTQKIKEDFQFKLSIQVEEEKSKLLTNTLGAVNSLTGKKEQELLDLRTKQMTFSTINKKLEDALNRSEEELERIRKESSKKKLFGWF
jgi:hypothetical protein